MGRIIAIANQKGGVGKTTTTLNLGAALAERGQRVLLIDFDPQGALTISLGVNPADLQQTVYDVLINAQTDVERVLLTPKPGIALLPATLDLAGAEVELLGELGREHFLKEKLAPVRDRYDFILIDCPPSLGLLTINALTAADQVLIPVQCQYLSFRGMQLLLRTIEKIQRRSNPHLTILGMLPTFYDVRTTHSKEVLNELRETYARWLLDVPIRYRIGLADAVVGGQSILEFDRRSDTAESYRKIAEVVAHAEAEVHEGHGR